MDPPNPPWSGQKTWHVARWGPLGWVETGIKLAAILLALVAALGGGAWSAPPDHALSFWALAAVAVGYVAAVADRWIDRELVALAFVFAMIGGHASMLYAMGGSEWPGARVRAFAGLMLLGDLVKIAYFAKTGARVRDLPRAVPLVMTGALGSIYLVVLIAA